MRIYVAGPMTGLPEYNLPAFADAAEKLVAAGFDAVNPGRGGVVPEFEWIDYMRRGLTELLTCDGVATLHGWTCSRGASIEIELAEKLGMHVEPLESWIFGASQ